MPLVAEFKLPQADFRPDEYYQHHGKTFTFISGQPILVIKVLSTSVDNIFSEEYMQ